MNLIPSMFLLAMASVVSLPVVSQSPAQNPEAAGISTIRLQRVDDFVARLEAEGKLAGAVIVVARRGQLVSLKAHGFADIEARRPMRTDDIFQLQSMTKPIATVATLMLLEEGRFLLSDPVAKYLPEFRDMKVAVSRTDAPDGFVLVPAERAITIHDLLTHRAGFVGLAPSTRPAAALRRKAVQSLPPDGDFTPSPSGCSRRPTLSCNTAFTIPSCRRSAIDGQCAPRGMTRRWISLRNVSRVGFCGTATGRSQCRA